MLKSVTWYTNLLMYSSGYGIFSVNFMVHGVHDPNANVPPPKIFVLDFARILVFNGLECFISSCTCREPIHKSCQDGPTDQFNHGFVLGVLPWSSYVSTSNCETFVIIKIIFYCALFARAKIRMIFIREFEKWEPRNLSQKYKLIDRSSSVPFVAAPLSNENQIVFEHTHFLFAYHMNVFFYRTFTTALRKRIKTNKSRSNFNYIRYDIVATAKDSNFYQLG